MKKLLFVLLLVPLSAQAEFYVGASFGGTDHDTDITDWSDGSVLGAGLDSSDAGYKVFIGRKITKEHYLLATNMSLGVEGFYIDFGEITLNGSSSGTGSFWSAGSISAAEESVGYGVAGLANIRIGNFTLFGKLGYYLWDTDRSFTNGAASSTSEDGTDLVWGFGGKYNFGKFAIRGEWESYEEVRDAYDINVVSIGIEYNFGAKAKKAK